MEGMGVLGTMTVEGRCDGDDGHGTEGYSRIPLAWAGSVGMCTAGSAVIPSSERGADEAEFMVGVGLFGIRTLVLWYVAEFGGEVRPNTGALQVGYDEHDVFAAEWFIWAVRLLCTVESYCTLWGIWGCTRQGETYLSSSLIIPSATFIAVAIHLAATEGSENLFQLKTTSSTAHL
ncbi:hypothetical protein V500_06674 [Pseudogymnoascus sp. VKM F-4518 (FW-2643)]|nr:hypothetical protein V500_06674 [Pseudogymnoascus sp. VKM F-4518 (FW-2643)]